MSMTFESLEIRFIKDSRYWSFQSLKISHFVCYDRVTTMELSSNYEELSFFQQQKDEGKTKQLKQML